jgi:hypothetical protein
LSLIFRKIHSDAKGAPLASRLLNKSKIIEEFSLAFWNNLVV